MTVSYRDSIVIRLLLLPLLNITGLFLNEYIVCLYIFILHFLKQHDLIRLHISGLSKRNGEQLKMHINPKEEVR